MNSFADIFLIILLRFKVFAFQDKNPKSTYYAVHVSSVDASKQKFK